MNGIELLYVQQNKKSKTKGVRALPPLYILETSLKNVCCMLLNKTYYLRNSGGFL
jgi:hypothetical protein